MKRFFITIEYDGTDLVGWQRQDNGPSVQQYLEEAAEELTGAPRLVQGSGRTDAGVHALGQVAHIDVPDKFDARAIMMGLNAKCRSPQIKVVKAKEVDAELHARFSATKRAYLYRIFNRNTASPLLRQQSWHVPRPLDADAMNEAAQRLVGSHDFTSFRATACQARSPVRTLDTCRVIKEGDEVHIIAEAQSFLHHQIRNITGTLSFVGLGKWTADDVTKALEAKDRSAAGPTAPPHGLYLSRIWF